MAGPGAAQGHWGLKGDMTKSRAHSPSGQPWGLNGSWQAEAVSTTNLIRSPGWGAGGGGQERWRRGQITISERTGEKQGGRRGGRQRHLGQGKPSGACERTPRAPEGSVQTLPSAFSGGWAGVWGKDPVPLGRTSTAGLTAPGPRAQVPAVALGTRGPTRVLSEGDKENVHGAPGPQGPAMGAASKTPPQLSDGGRWRGVVRREPRGHGFRRSKAST